MKLPPVGNNMHGFFIVRLSHQCGDVELGQAFMRRMARSARRTGSICAVNFQYVGYYPGAPCAYSGDVWRHQLPHSHYDDQSLCAMRAEAAGNGLLTLCTPYDEDAAEKAVEHGFDFVMLENYQSSDWPLLEKVARINMPIVLSVDGRDAVEIARVGTFLKNRQIDCSFLREAPHERKDGPNLPAGAAIDTRFLKIELVEGGKGSFGRLAEYGISNHGSRFLCEVTVDLRAIGCGTHAEQLERLLSGEGVPLLDVSHPVPSGLQSYKRGVFARGALPHGTRLDSDNTFCALSCGETQLLAEDMSKYMVHALRDNLDAGAPVDKSAVISRNIRDPGGNLVFEQVECSEKRIAGVPCLQYSNSRCRGKKVVLHLHGGGYVSGSPHDARFSTMHLAEHASFDILSVGYRLAPQYPFPAAAEDLLAVYRSLLADGYPSSSVGFYGESAGGGLILSAALMLRDQGEPLPAALVCSSPWADLTNSSGCHSDEMNAADITLKTWILNENARAYAGSKSLEHPYISPCYGIFAGFPPLLLYAGTREILKDDAVRVAKQAEQDGVDVKLRVVNRMPHVFTSMPGVFAEADVAIREILHFFDVRLQG